VQPPTLLTVNCVTDTLTTNLSSPLLGSCIAIGGKLPYTVSVIAGTLPPGISMSVDSGYIYFRGLPAASGTFTFTLLMTDSSTPMQTVTSPVTITIAPRPLESGLVTVTATSGGITNTTTIAVSVP
jgi:large repetitive protein